MYQKIEVRDENAHLLGWIHGDYDIDPSRHFSIAIPCVDRNGCIELRLNVVRMVSSTGRHYKALVVHRDFSTLLMQAKCFTPESSLDERGEPWQRRA